MNTGVFSRYFAHPNPLLTKSCSSNTKSDVRYPNARGFAQETSLMQTFLLQANGVPFSLAGAQSDAPTVDGFGILMKMSCDYDGVRLRVASTATFYGHSFYQHH